MQFYNRRPHTFFQTRTTPTGLIHSTLLRPQGYISNITLPRSALHLQTKTLSKGAYPPSRSLTLVAATPACSGAVKDIDLNNCQHNSG